MTTTSTEAQQMYENTELTSSPYSDKIKIWERIIDVQKHFNEIKSKNQTLFISVITASLIATGYLFTKDCTTVLHIGNVSISFFSLPILGAAMLTIPFYVLDCGIYQVLLHGAVECGKDFEVRILKRKLTSSIIDEVSEQHTFIVKGASNKLHFFYLSFMVVLIALWAVLNRFSALLIWDGIFFISIIVLVHFFSFIAIPLQKSN